MTTLAEELAKPGYAAALAALDAAEAAAAPLAAAATEAQETLRMAEQGGAGDATLATLRADMESKLAAAHAALATATTQRQAIADTINAATVSRAKPIAGENVQRYLMVVGKWPKIEALARGLITGTDNEILTAVGLVSALATLKTFDFSVPAYAAACQDNLAACVALGLMTADDRAHIEAMATESVPLRETIGFGRALDHGDIMKARAA